MRRPSPGGTGYAEGGVPCATNTSVAFDGLVDGLYRLRVAAAGPAPTPAGAVTYSWEVVSVFVDSVLSSGGGGGGGALDGAGRLIVDVTERPTSATVPFVLPVAPVRGERVALSCGVPSGAERFVSVEPAQLVFTDTTWSVPQQVVVTGLEDGDNSNGPAHSHVVNCSLASGGPANRRYLNGFARDLLVRVTNVVRPLFVDVRLHGVSVVGARGLALTVSKSEPFELVGDTTGVRVATGPLFVPGVSMSVGGQAVRVLNVTHNGTRLVAATPSFASVCGDPYNHTCHGAAGCVLRWWWFVVLEWRSGCAECG